MFGGGAAGTTPISDTAVHLFQPGERNLDSITDLIWLDVVWSEWLFG